MLSPLALGWMLQPSGLLHLKFKQEHLYTSPEIFSEEKNLRTFELILILRMQIKTDLTVD